MAGCSHTQQPTVTPPGTTSTPLDTPTSTFTAMPDALPGAATVLLNGTLIDGTGTDPVSDAIVVIQEKRIAAVGPRAQVEIPANAQIIDVQGAVILPGFIDAHVHSAYNRSHLEAWAQDGVTTVRDLGNDGPRGALFTFRDGVRDEPQCARLVAVGPYVTVPGGYPIVPWGAGALTVTSPEDARQKIEQLLDDGADLIKIALESGDIFQRAGLTQQRLPMLSPETAAVIVEIAHERGTLVAAHVTVSQDLEKAIDVGVDNISHMVVDSLPDELVERLIEADVYWTPTLGLWESVSEQYRVGVKANAIANLQRFAAAGGKTALGSDYGDYIAEFGMPIREIELMQEASMTPAQIIVAGTQNAATVCNLEHETGTLEAGKAADVLVVDGDPTKDVHALTRPKLVLRDGVVIRS